MMGLSTLVLITISGVALALDCYAPNGTSRNALIGLAPLGRYVPCSNETTHSMCCSQRSGGQNLCISENRFCDDQSGTIWRESCTDPTWQDPACIKLFVNGTGYPGTSLTYLANGESLTDVQITICDDGETYCYGNNNRACCQQGQGFYIDDDGFQTDSDPKLAANATTSSASSSSDAASPTSDLDMPQSPGMSTGAKAGIGVGVGAAVLLALFIGAWLFTRKRKQREMAIPQQPVQAVEPAKAYEQSQFEPLSPIAEVSSHKYHQMGDSHGELQERAELEGLSPARHAASPP